MNPGGLAPGGMNLYGHFAEPPRPEQQCPHCNGISQIVPSPELHYVCSICGGPRVPLPEGLAPSDALVATLRRAEAARSGRSFARGLTIAGGIGAGFGAILFTLGALIGGIGWGIALGAIFGGPFLIALARGMSRSSTKASEMNKLVDAAWAIAAADVMRAGKGNTASDLASALKIDIVRAEQLHAMVGLDASLTPGPDERVRVNVPPDPRFEALEQRARIASAPSQSSIEAEAEAEAAIHGGARVPPKST
jgi:hypothetical protein